jgi:hypothetical protein
VTSEEIVNPERAESERKRKKRKDTEKSVHAPARL